MNQSDSQMQRMFIQATDEVVTPAPWLESRVVDTLHRRGQKGRRPRGLAVLSGFGSGLRLTAALVAVLLVVAVVASVLMSTRLLHGQLVPGNRPAVQTPVQTVPFTPSPAVRDPNWPAGGPVPAQLSGAWQPPQSAPIWTQASYSGCTLYLAAYTFQVGDEHTGPGNHGFIGPPLFGNVVVNGSEIDFMSDICTSKGGFGFERFTFTLNGNTLVLSRAAGPGQSNCTWGSFQSLWPTLPGTYTRRS